jgi:Protein of unknown function (DUF1161)
MPHNSRMLRLLLPLALLASASAARADNCDAIRAAIETKFRGNGVANPVLTVLPQSAMATGRVVGSCDKGAKKIVYTAAAPNGASTGATPAPPAPRAAAPVLTECADGRVITGGSCKK